MKNTTLCFLRRDDMVLLAMKKRGFGIWKYNGVGGKVEHGETILEATAREAKEEINVVIDANRTSHYAQIDFQFDKKSEWNQVCHVYISSAWEGEPTETEEMKPRWFNINNLPFENMWIDDPHWLPLVLSGKKIKAEFVFNEEGSEILSKKIEIEG